MRIISPRSIRELADELRKKMPTMSMLTDLLNEVANELESRDAEIDGLKRALEAKEAAR